MGQKQYDDDDGDTEEDSDEDEEEPIDLTEDITHLRTWEEGGARKRTAKEVANDENESEENRLKATEWLKETYKRAKKDKAGKGKGRRTGDSRKYQARRRGATSSTGTRTTRATAQQTARGGGGGPT